MRLIISFRIPDINARDAEGGNQTHVKELYAIISLQLLITPTRSLLSVRNTRTQLVLRSNSTMQRVFFPTSPNCALLSHVALYRGISNSNSVSFASDALPSTSLTRGFSKIISVLRSENGASLSRRHFPAKFCNESLPIHHEVGD